jgi:hypothetical protein
MERQTSRKLSLQFYFTIVFSPTLFGHKILSSIRAYTWRNVWKRWGTMKGKQHSCEELFARLIDALDTYRSCIPNP